MFPTSPLKGFYSYNVLIARAIQSTIGVIKESLRKEGAMFMFKGWVPAWTRLQPTTILIFLTLEQLKNGVDISRAKGFTFL